jgi:secreted trypsin-like serine protease
MHPAPQAREARYPYSASLQHDSQHFCGGALVAPDVVVTAAHCDSTTTITGVVLGRYDLDSPTDDDYEVMEVVYALVHPMWDPINVSNDVALLLLGGESRHPYVRINGDGLAPTEGEHLAVLGEWRWSFTRFSRFPGGGGGR